VKKHDLVFGWFASWHTFLPIMFAKLLGKPSVVVVGGYDVAKIPEIGYGHQRGGLKKWVSRWTMRSATQVLAISCFSSNEALRNASIPQDRMHTLALGVPDSFERLPQSPRSPLILTVGNVDRPNLRRKGHEPFVKTAALMPGADFVLVGAWKDEAAIEYLRSIATPNVFFAGRVDDQSLLDYYRKASVYVQPSLHEGFGLSVAEAMLAGCVPVVTRAGALPEVVGPRGEYIDSTAAHNIARAIQTALAYSESERAKIRQRILDEFPMEKRRRALERIVTELTLHTSH
jgi:glycosyltransferase involved in cell wall biosynthesis